MISIEDLEGSLSNAILGKKYGCSASDVKAARLARAIETRPPEPLPLGSMVWRWIKTPKGVWFPEGMWCSPPPKLKRSRPIATYFSGCHSPDQIRARYRQLASKHHPDKGGSNEVMAQINKAYELRRALR